MRKVEAEKVQSKIQTDEVNILLSFKDQVEFPIYSSGLWLSWKATDENACAWVGVICTVNFTVEELDFSGWRITRIGGGLRSFSQLPDLRRLRLTSNGLKSAFLDFSRNHIFGNIPGNISLCRMLRYLSLEQNSLDGAIPNLSGLGNLKVLSLAHNSLTGSFPNGVAELKSLVSIDISGNKLNETIPSLSNLTNLLDLRLEDYFFNNFEESFAPGIPKSLKFFRVSGNQLARPIPAV